MPFRLVLTLIVVLCAAPAAQAAVPQPRTLDSGWEFKRDPYNEGLAAGWAGGAWQDEWEDVQVPHVFDPQPTSALFGGTIGWYRLRFDAGEVPADWHWALRFEGARRVSRVWLNGRHIGSNGNPYQPFTLMATSLRKGRNELVVRVHNFKTARVREGWWNWGGLVRPVHLEPRGAVHWEDVGLLSDVEGGSRPRAVVRADGWLVNRTDRVAHPQIVVALRSPTDGTISSVSVRARNLKPGERRRVKPTLRIKGAPALWSPAHPHLYEGFVEVREGVTVHQHDRRRTGLRYIRLRNGRLYLNERLVQVRGASIQEDLPGRGPALRPSDIEQIVADLKALKANVTRAQYPLNEALLDRFDEEGILVWSQAPVYHEDRELATPRGREHGLRKVRGTVLYARNHPSVMTHSVANELSPEPDKHPGTKAFLLRAAHLARDLDATVPVSVDLLSYPSIPRQEAYARFGLLGINSYYGWYKGKPGRRSTAKLSMLAPYLTSMRRKYPDAAMLITEFGAEATYHGPANVKETYAFQSRYVSRTLDIVDRLDWLSGAIYWTVREFYVKPDWDGGANRTDIERDALHNKGLITYDGTPKPAFRIAQKRFADTPLYPAPTVVTPAKRRRR